LFPGNIFAFLTEFRKQEDKLKAEEGKVEGSAAELG
jgi:hypothetical protein